MPFPWLRMLQWPLLKSSIVNLTMGLFNSVTQSCPTPMNRSTPGLPVHHQLPEFTQTHVHWVSDAIQPSHPLSSPSPPAPNPSQHQGLFQWVNSSHEVAKVLEFSFNISPSNEHPELISFRMDWLDLPAVQETLKSLLQYHSSKASILQHSAFYTVQLSHPYMTTRKTIALTRWTFVGKIMSLIFNMLSRLVITFLPRSKRLLISWPQSPSAVILEKRDLFKKIRDTKETFHAKMGSIRDRNGMDLKRKQKILRRGGNTQKNCTKKIFTT